MQTTFPIAVGPDGSAADAFRAEAQIDTVKLRDQLGDIRDALSPLLADQGSPLSLSELEIGLTLSASGKVMFIAEAGIEASITLTFSRASG